MKKLTTAILMTLVGVSVWGQDANKIESTGDVGIGTTNPESKLHTKDGNVCFEFASNYPERHKVVFESLSLDRTNPGQTFYRWSGSSSKYWATSMIREANTGFTIQMANAANVGGHIFDDALRINNNGNVGIGTTSPGAKLDVAGTIKAQEIEVTLASIDNMNLNGTLAANNITLTTNGQTADFVFDDNYNLRPLDEVEQFITSNKHLPNIPSAEAMEEAGVNLAEMNKLLLQKIEELTLYAIEQEKVRCKEFESRRGLESEFKRIMEERRREAEDRKKEKEKLKRLEKELEAIKAMLEN